MPTVAHATPLPALLETDRREREQREHRGLPVFFLASKVVSVVLLANYYRARLKSGISLFVRATCEESTSPVPHTPCAVPRLGTSPELSQYLQKYFHSTCKEN